MDKPSRGPDYVTSYGSAFWWEEMIYQAAFGEIKKMSISGDDGKLIIKDNDKPRVLSDAIQREYAKWWHDVFESKILGE
jgi:hypothetical protein